MLQVAFRRGGRQERTGFVQSAALFWLRKARKGWHPIRAPALPGTETLLDFDLRAGVLKLLLEAFGFGF